MAELVKVPINSDVADSFRHTIKDVLKATFPDANVKVEDGLVIFEHSAEPTEKHDGFYHKISIQIVEIKMR